MVWEGEQLLPVGKGDHVSGKNNFTPDRKISEGCEIVRQLQITSLMRLGK